MYTEKEALHTIKVSNDKQIRFLEETKNDKEYTVSRKTMNDNAIAIDWLIKYIDRHCKPEN